MEDSAPQQGHSGEAPAVWSGAQHTRVPNLLLNFVFPRLTGAQTAVLLYILRRTVGFAAPEGGRKKWDRISLDQFVDGVRTRDGLRVDLGTGLRRPTVQAALKDLIDYKIIAMRYSCPLVVAGNGRTAGCGWDQTDELSRGDTRRKVEIDKRTRAGKCPVCTRTLSKSYSLRTISAGNIRQFLNHADHSGAPWEWDIARNAFRPNTDEKPAPPSFDEQRDQLRSELWFPDLVDRIAGQANSQLKNRRMSTSRLVNEYYDPVVQWQRGERYKERDGSFASAPPQAAVRHALQVVIDKKIAARSRRGTGATWLNYANQVALTFVADRTSGGTHADAEQRQREMAVERQLEQCATLNETGEQSKANQILYDILSNNLDELAAEFGGDRNLARRHIMQAFKIGVADYRGVREMSTPFNFKDDFDWETDERREANERPNADA